MIENPICAQCIRMSNGNCTKNQVSPIPNGTCRYFIERDKYVAQSAPPKVAEVAVEEKADLKDVEIGRLNTEIARMRAELERLKVFMPKDPVEEMIAKLMPKFRTALELGFLTSYRDDDGDRITVVHSSDLKKLMAAGLVSKQKRSIMITREMAWFTPEFEARIRQKLATDYGDKQSEKDTSKDNLI